MSDVSPSIAEALEPLRAMLTADGYELDLTDDGDEAILVSITAGPDACAECLAPKEMMKIYFDDALKTALGDEAPDVSLAYPADH